MKLNLESLKNGEFEGKGYILPRFDIGAMRERTKKSPAWLHFGAGNILRAFPCVLLQTLLERGGADTGMIVAEAYDEEIITRAFAPYDNLCLAVSLKSDGSVEKRVVASVAEALGYRANRARIEEVFVNPGLQMVSMTITEKGYAVTDADGAPLRYCAGDFLSMDDPVSQMGILARLLHLRYRAGALPVAMVSLDNCAHNGDILKSGVVAIAESWREKGLADDGFLDYLTDGTRVSFTWSMIDKITPRPSEEVVKMLEADGFTGARVSVTAKNTYVSAMVNAEECEYLAIEDAFPNGRPRLEAAGVIFASRETVDRIEKMKVCTCLNPLHTCLAVFGCLMGYQKISDEMRDDQLSALVRRLGYDESMPVVVDPGVMSAEKFIGEVINLRFPNPFVPDTPQRIACDTSKKLPVRFGETLKAYVARGREDLSFLNFIPLVFAGYARYLTGIGDDGAPFTRSPDPNLESLGACVSGYRLGEFFDTARLRPLFSRADVFGVDLYRHSLGEKAEALFARMNRGPGAVRETIRSALDGAGERPR